jgi:SAM-dependent methyltransferase
MLSGDDYEKLYTSGAYASMLVQETKAHRTQDFRRHATYRPFFQNVSVREHPRLLDVACGTGRFCKAAKAAGWDVTGFDPSCEAVSTARELSDSRFHEMGLDEAALQFRDCDVVTAFEFLEHGEASLATLAQMAGMVRKGGLVFATVPCWDSRHVRGMTSPVAVPPVHLQFFTHDSLGRLFRRAGLGDIIVGGIRLTPRVVGWYSFLSSIRRRFEAPVGLYALGRRI